MPLQPKTANLIQVNLALVIWGGTAMFAKGIELPLVHVVCMRSLVGAAALLICLPLMRASMRIRSRKHGGVMLISGVLLCIHWLTYFQALRLSSAAVAILALNTYPVFTALVEPIVFREKLRTRDLLMTVIVLAGVLIMTPQISLSNSVTRGILIGVLSGLLFMVRNLFIRRYVREYASSTLMFWQMLVSGIVLVPLLWHRDAAYTVKQSGLLLLLGVMFTALPQVLFAAGHRHLSARTVGVLNTLLVVYGALFGYLIHDEILTWRTALGGAVVLTCIIWETLRAVKPAGTLNGNST